MLIYPETRSIKFDVEEDRVGRQELYIYGSVWSKKYHKTPRKNEIPPTFSCQTV